MNIPVFRDNKLKAAKSIVQSINSAKNGWSIVIFPEGGIPDDNNPKMIPFKNGAFQIAKAAKLPIVPISFTNNYKLFSDPSFILGPARPGISNVYIHDYISSEEVAKSDLETLNKKCFKIINEPILKTHPHLAQ
jgi:1-acyl-sn-glycerol-3-phosphate acyltransferase